MTIRWISYTQQHIPGNQSFDLNFHLTLSDAINAYRDYCEAVGMDDCSMSLYFVPKDEEEAMVSCAQEFESIGCPFDYPSKIVERGPKGGIKITQA